MKRARQQSRPFLSLAAFAAAILAITFSLAAIPARAQTYTDLHDFNAAAGDPTTFNSTKFAQGRDGNFYLESRAGYPRLALILGTLTWVEESHRSRRLATHNVANLGHRTT